MSPPDSYSDALTPKGTVFGDRVFNEVTEGHKDGALLQ